MSVTKTKAKLIKKENDSSKENDAIITPPPTLVTASPIGGPSIDFPSEMSSKCDDTEKEEDPASLSLAQLEKCQDFQPILLGLLQASSAERSKSYYNYKSLVIQASVVRKSSSDKEKESESKSKDAKTVTLHKAAIEEAKSKLRQTLVSELILLDAWMARRGKVDLTSAMYQIFQVDGSMYQIFVRLMNGQTITLDICATDTIEKIKYIIQHQTRTNFLENRLIFAACQLEDHRTVEFYNIKKHATLFCVINMKGS
jgi:Ubiquitin family